jgi:hypothetical protein
MSYSFATNFGKSAFGSIVESKTAGEYILNKKATTTYCYPKICPVPTIKNVNTEGNLLLKRKSEYLNTYENIITFNKTNLYVNIT